MNAFLSHLSFIEMFLLLFYYTFMLVKSVEYNLHFFDFFFPSQSLISKQSCFKLNILIVLVVQLLTSFVHDLKRKNSNSSSLMCAS